MQLHFGSRSNASIAKSSGNKQLRAADLNRLVLSDHLKYPQSSPLTNLELSIDTSSLVPLLDSNLGLSR